MESHKLAPNKALWIPAYQSQKQLILLVVFCCDRNI